MWLRADSSPTAKLHCQGLGPYPEWRQTARVNKLSSVRRSLDGAGRGATSLAHAMEPCEEGQLCFLSIHVLRG